VKSRPGAAGAATGPLYLRRVQLGVMQNWVYLVGSAAKRRCVVVDPAWNVDAIFRQAEQDGVEIVGALVTHWHPDHVGGDLFGHDIEGLAKLLERQALPIHVNRHELDGVAQVAGVSKGDLVGHDGGDAVEVDDVTIRLLHTPGHTPGSQCFLCHGHLLSGDTLFIRSCGRVDLPGGNAEQMWKSLNTVLKRLPPETVLHPGHQYGPIDASTIGEEARLNPAMNAPRLEDWLGMMGRGF
jgi:glyoxylase-like metal-dependent hydrolase (beta-lactamase superfamily II)